MIVDTLRWLADKLMERGRERDKKARDQWDRVAKYFDDIGATIEKMVAQFRNEQIPRVEGNQLTVLLSHFDEVVHSIYSRSDDKDKEQTDALMRDLYRTADDATNLDMQHAAIGYFGKQSPFGPVDDILANMERIAGRYKGLAASLRASAVN